MSAINPIPRPLYVMAKPVGSRCNLACTYCYYLEKQVQAGVPDRGVMSDDMLELFVREYIRSRRAPHVCFTWHGGEPLLRGLAFYRRAVELQHRYAEGCEVSNSLQTNGLLLTPEWCRFLHDEGWLVGLSIDGPRSMHDAFRRDAKGRPTWERVLRAARMLDEYGVEWNAMVAVNTVVAASPSAFYRFFRDELRCRYLQLSPVVECYVDRGGRRRLASPDDADAKLAPYSVGSDEWGRFLCGVFDEWVVSDVGHVFVETFDATLACWMGVAPGICVYGRECGHAAVLEADGSVYSCDHYVFPSYRLGDLATQSLRSLLDDERQRLFGQAKWRSLPHQCRECEWLFACYGECPRLRFCTTPQGEPGLNYLCEGYRRYFRHVAPAMDFMKKELLAGRPASNVMWAWRG
ncbi:MAG: anaerobic sulfatase-maturation protein [Bacteroidaceae bacterium]|nr:anaerobic sulfatase-maturation protein [Bacteroidaceae bacterium]